MTLYEIGRICVKVVGREAGSHCVVVEEKETIGVSTGYAAQATAIFCAQSREGPAEGLKMVSRQCTRDVVCGCVVDRATDMRGQVHLTDRAKLPAWGGDKPSAGLAA